MRALICDGNNLLWRSSGHAHMTHNGIRTEAIFIGLNMMRSYLQRFEPESCTVVWDGGRDSRRTTKHKTYKRKKRQPTPVEKRERRILFSQAELLQFGLELLGISQYRCKGFEADDIIYNLTKALEPKWEAVVVSTDEDMFQLFVHKKNLIVYSPTKDKVITRSDVEKKFGFPVEYFTTYKALAGDSSDNIPGVPGIGTVKAKQLIKILQMDDSELTDSKDIHLLSAFHTKMKDFEMMHFLVQFHELPVHTLLEGHRERVPDSKRHLDESAQLFLTSLGFQKHLDNFVEFIAPFERYWEKVK